MNAKRNILGKREKLLLTGISTLFLFVGCEQALSPDSSIESLRNDPIEQSAVGVKLENPYTVETMLRAKDSLEARGVLSKTIINNDEFRPTHYYIRFKPNTTEEYFELKQNNELVLWDYPLDYKFPEGMSTYRDPEIPEGIPNFLYTTIEIGQKLNFTNYEILAELILSPEDEDSTLAKKTNFFSFYDILEQEALRITGNTPKNEQGLAKTLGSKWRPTGNIQVYDDVLGKNVPVVSVNVRTRNWFKWWNGYTDANGNFRCSKEYRGDLSYSLKWQYPHNRFDIRSGYIGQAFFNGPSQKRGAWNLVISSGMSWVYAHIYRAGAFYVGQEPFGLKDRPFDLISILAIDGNSPSNYNGWYLIANENIRVYKNWNSGRKRTAAELFRLTSHELGHAHHDEIYDGSMWLNVKDKLSESWAVAIAYYMASTVYGANSVNEIPGCEPDVSHQIWTNSSNERYPDYTPIMVDLIDKYNQQKTDSRYLQDQVSGYTLKQFETIIAKNSCKNLGNFISEVKKLPLPSGISATTRDNYLNQY